MLMKESVNRFLKEADNKIYIILKVDQNPKLRHLLSNYSWKEMDVNFGINFLCICFIRKGVTNVNNKHVHAEENIFLIGTNIKLSKLE